MPLRLSRALLAIAMLGIALAALAGCATTSGGGTQRVVVADRAQALDQAYAQFWEESMQLNPLQATFQGDYRYDDRMPNFLGADYRKRAHDFNRRWLDKVEAIGNTGLEGRDLVSYQIFVHDARAALQAEQFPSWQLPINQFYSVANLAVTLGSGNGAQPFRSVDDYDDWHQRASGFPTVFDQAIANMRAGVAAGNVQPRALMEGVVPQLDAIIKDKAEDSAFWTPVKTMPPAFEDADKARITAAYRKLIEGQLMPAYRRLRDYIARDYLPHTRSGVGLGGLPEGAAWYAYDVRRSTGTEMTPQQVHETGLKEVARLQGEIRGLMQRIGFNGSLQDFFGYMREDKRFAYADEDALLARYRAIQAQVEAGLPELFSLLPRAPLEIHPVEPYRANAAPAVEYRGGSADGTQPAVFYVNTADLATRRTWEAPVLFAYGALPGHHLQSALQQQLTDLPRFRRYGGETAFVEGWAVYAETLGDELGLYQDPHDRFGFLHNQLRRALRLVADTGLHAMGWNRERVVRYLLDNSALTAAEADAEAERYMAVPGQALAYTIGALKFHELRDKAEKALGDGFDIRAFHAEVLGDGSLPLGVLTGKLDRWMAARQQAAKRDDSNAGKAGSTQGEGPGQAGSGLD